MRYTPAFLESIKDKSIFNFSDYNKSNPMIFAYDIAFIGDWLDNHFYCEFGDPIDLSPLEKVDYAAVLLSNFYNDLGAVDTVCSHYDLLTEWLEAHNDNEQDDPSTYTLLDILQNMSF